MVREAQPVRIRTRAETLGSPDGNGVADATMPTTGPLVDAFGRIHRDLRISVTDRCNLRCTYCMPEEGVVFLPRQEVLSYEEITRVAAAAHRLGVTTVRLSGGEPLLRQHLHRLVGYLSGVGFEDIAATTNGMFLAARAAELRDAGLNRVNVSCDSLDPEQFARIRRGGHLATVLAAMDAAEVAGLTPVKVNVVLVAGINDGEVEAFAAFGRETGRTVRFIEFMPLDASGTWDRSLVVAAGEVVERIGSRWPLEPVPDQEGGPAVRYRYRDGAGEVGVIASVTQPFCGSCDRLRLTADGNVRNCLFAHEEISVRDILRGDQVGDGAIETALRRAVWRKRAGHGIGEPDFTRPRRTMSMIGG